MRRLPVGLIVLIAVVTSCSSNDDAPVVAATASTATSTASTTVPSSTVASRGDASGVTGQVLVGPTCPVERDPPDPACADRPASNARVTVTRSSDSAVIATTRTDTEGRFRVTVAPGDYEITAQAGMHCESSPVHVDSGRYTELTISCDSGIR